MGSSQGTQSGLFSRDHLGQQKVGGANRVWFRVVLGR